MIWRQVTQRMVRAKLHMYLFHLNFVKMKKFFTILTLKQPNPESSQYTNIRDLYFK